MLKRAIWILALLLCLPVGAEARDRERPKPENARVFGPSAAWTPASPTKGGISPEHWYKADAGTYQAAGGAVAVLDGDAVGQWQDQAVSADHVAQAAAGNKPTLQLNELKGKPVIRFDGTDDYLSGLFTVGGVVTQPLTYFLVAKMDASVIADGTHRYAIDGNIRSIIRKSDADKWNVYFAAHLVGSAADANANIWTASINGALSSFWINGGLQASGNAGGAEPNDIIVGAYRDGSSDYWKGDIPEILIYEANLSSADKNQVLKYLSKKYGIAYTKIP